MIAFTITVIFRCFPVEALWKVSMERKCMNINTVTKAGAFASIVEDLIIMVLPISELKGLNLNLRKRTALCFMFALGSL
ncbi:hypothetical protein BDZ45DRAFT_591268 [Acephala macrosclerotiorum]|nr:hypothetical protein BDZ45DRAFT_591268 [Acephala macrosclerotiorum]